jgi:hypothetical protein
MSRWKPRSGRKARTAPPRQLHYHTYRDGDWHIHLSERLSTTDHPLLLRIADQARRTAQPSGTTEIEVPDYDPPLMVSVLQHKREVYVEPRSQFNAVFRHRSN